MLAPRISLKQLLLFMAVLACCFGIASIAYRGNVVAFGLACSLAGLTLLFLIYFCSYWLLYGLARLRFRQLQPLDMAEKRGKLTRGQST